MSDTTGQAKALLGCDKLANRRLLESRRILDVG